MLLRRSRFNRSRPACGITRSRARASSISSWRTDEPCGEKNERRLRQVRATRDRVRGKWRRCRGVTLERRNHFRGQCVRGCRQIRRSGRERGRCTRLAPGLRSGDSPVRHGTGGRCRSIAADVVAGQVHPRLRIFHSVAAKPRQARSGSTAPVGAMRIQGQTGGACAQAGEIGAGEGRTGHPAGLAGTAHGTATLDSSASTTRSGSMPSASASKLSSTRCLSTSGAITCMSWGAT